MCGDVRLGSIGQAPTEASAACVLSLLLLLLLLLLLCRVWALLPYRKRRKTGPWHPLSLSQQGRVRDSKTAKSSCNRTVNTVVVLGSGGHTSEMLKLTAHLDPEIYTPLCYVVASTDSTSAERIPSSGLRAGRCRVCRIPRSREVGQSYFSSVWTTIVAAFHSVAVVANTCPDLLLVNGPGTCIPVCVAVFALRVVGLRPHSRIVFCESFCRVKSLSLSGRIMYFLADRFVVHWPELLSRYPRAEYIGQLM